MALFDDINAITDNSWSWKPKTLPAATPVPAIPARTGSSAPISKASTGGGIASPVTEDAANGRDYWTDRPIISVDGLIYGKWAPIKTLNMHDANSNVVVFSFRDQA